MYRTLTLTAVALAATSLTLAACGDNNAGNVGQTEGVNAAQDAASAVVGATSAATIGATTVDGFVTALAVGDMYEIRAAEMAMERSGNAAVRDVAQTILTDHTASSAKLKAMVEGGQAEGATIPAMMDERRQGLIDNLRAASDADFDNVWLDQQANAHREALILLNGYETAGGNDALKAFAEEIEPKIQMHLDAITAVDRGPAQPQ